MKNVLPLSAGAIVKDAPRADAIEHAIASTARILAETAGMEVMEEDLTDFLKSSDASRLRSEMEGVLLHILLKRKARHLSQLQALAR